MPLDEASSTGRRQRARGHVWALRVAHLRRGPWLLHARAHRSCTTPGAVRQDRVPMTGTSKDPSRYTRQPREPLLRCDARATPYRLRRHDLPQSETDM